MHERSDNVAPIIEVGRLRLLLSLLRFRREAGPGPNGRRLAGTITPQKCERLSFGNGEGNAVEHGLVPKALVQILDVKIRIRSQIVRRCILLPFADH